MAITTYSELQTAIGNRIPDSTVTSSVQQECIALAEAEIQRRLRTTDMETKNATFSINAEFVNTPTDLLVVREFYLNTAVKTQLTQATGEYMTLTQGGGSNVPAYYEVVGSQFRFAPAPDATYSATLIYYAKITALSGSNTTNWLLTAHPDLYLYGACKHAAIKLQDAEASAGYASLFEQALQGVQAASNRKTWGGTMQTRPG